MLITTLSVMGCIGTDIVEDIIIAEQLSINSRLETLAIGDMHQFEAEFFNELGVRVDSDISWSSSDNNVITINASGLATGISQGTALIRAASGAAQDSLAITVGAATNIADGVRRGSFRGLRQYTVNGSFTLVEDGDNLELTFSSDFTTSSGPGLFVYLSNSSARTNGGIEVGSLKQNIGAQSYSISRSMAGLDTYDHVIIYCKPFRLAFGTGEFDN